MWLSFITTIFLVHVSISINWKPNSCFNKYVEHWNEKLNQSTYTYLVRVYVERVSIKAFMLCDCFYTHLCMAITSVFCLLWLHWTSALFVSLSILMRVERVGVIWFFCADKSTHNRACMTDKVRLNFDYSIIVINCAYTKRERVHIAIWHLSVCVCVCVIDF